MVRDRVAALMVRAAVSGAMDYTTADPYNKTWRVKHSLILQEITRLDDEKIIQAVQRHWLAYVANSSLEKESWEKVKDHAADALKGLQRNLFPWVKLEETEAKKDTIEHKYGDLIAQYRAMMAQKNSAADKEQAGN